jgi:hypothetical protein
MSFLIDYFSYHYLKIRNWLREETIRPVLIIICWFAVGILLVGSKPIFGDDLSMIVKKICFFALIPLTVFVWMSGSALKEKMRKYNKWP